MKPANGRRHSAVSLTALAYADDVVITSDSANGAERTLSRLLLYSQAIGLKFNTAITKVLHVAYGSDPKPILTLDGTTIDICDVCNYLGLPIISSKVVIHQRFVAVCSAIGKLHLMFHSTAPSALKIKLFKSAVNTIAAYALESLPLYLMTSSMLDAGHRQMILPDLGINWQNNFTKDDMWPVVFGIAQNTCMIGISVLLDISLFF